jgi:hypothetical protein
MSMNDKKIESLIEKNTERDIFNMDEMMDDDSDSINIIKTGISFGHTEATADPVTDVTDKVVEKTSKEKEEVDPAVQQTEDNFKETNKSLVIKKINNIQIGKLVTIIYGDFGSQKVLNGKVVSVIDNGITVLSNDKEAIDPIVVLFDTIIDIFEVKKFKKKKNSISMFKIKKNINEFFNGNEEELKHAYEQKISVKKLRQELRKKNHEHKQD